MQPVGKIRTTAQFGGINLFQRKSSIRQIWAALQVSREQIEAAAVNCHRWSVGQRKAFRNQFQAAMFPLGISAVSFE